MIETGWKICPRCKSEILRRVYDEHYEYCLTAPRPEETAKKHSAEFKVTITREGSGKNERFNFRCSCGKDGKVWYTTRNAVYEAIEMHRRFPKLG